MASEVSSQRIATTNVVEESEALFDPSASFIVAPDSIKKVNESDPAMPKAKRAATASSEPPSDVQTAQTNHSKHASSTEPERIDSLETTIFHVFVNGSDKGVHFFQQDKNAGIWSTVSTLKEMGISELPAFKAQAEGEPLALSRLQKEISYKLSENNGELQLSVQPKWLPRQHLKLSDQTHQQGDMLSGNSAFLNYNANYGWADAVGSETFSLPLEVGARLGAFFLSSNVQYSRSRNQWLRTQSQLVWDDQQNMIRVSAGDVSSSTGTAGIGATLGGITIARNFGLQPYRITTPKTSFDVMIPTQSEVKFYINGNLVKTETVEPGRLTITDPPVYSGQSDLEVVIRDAFGRETRQIIPYFYSPELLNEGLDEFSFSAGLLQQRGINGRIEYSGTPAFLGFWRTNITDWMTAALHGAYQGGSLNAGVSSSIITGSVGALNLLFSSSRIASTQGISSSLNYNMTGWKGISPNLFFRTSTPAYRSIFELGANQRNRWEAGAGLSFHLSKRGSVSARFSSQKRQNGSKNKLLSIFYSTRLFHRIGLTLNGTWDRDSTKLSIQKDYSMGLNYLFENGLSLNLNANSNNNVLSGSLQLQMNVPLAEGFGYSASVQKSEQSNLYNSNERFNYLGRHGSVAISRSGNTKNGLYNASLSGSLAFAGHSFYLSRPISDGFAVVQTKGMKELPVSYNNQYIGSTNSDGELLIPNLIAYNDNKIGIDVGNIPLGYQVESVEKVVSLPFRSGGVVSFGIEKIQAVEGIFFIKDSKSKKEAQYYGLDLIQGDKKTTAIVGYGGAFYIENISTGAYKARLFNAKRACEFAMTIPTSDDMIINLGKITCSMPTEVK